MQQKTTKIIYAYWNEVRAGRIAPRRFEIEPSRIGSILPDTFILERIDDATYRFRLAGTRIFEEFGIEFRGENFLAHWPPTDRQLLQHQFKIMTTQGGVVVMTFKATASSGGEAVYEAILLPLTHTHQTIDRFVGAVSCVSPAPVWLGTERLNGRVLIDLCLVWPDGRPHAVLERSRSQAPFLPHVRGARLVRSDRRQFRVYDGGLSKVNHDDN